MRDPVRDSNASTSLANSADGRSAYGSSSGRFAASTVALYAATIFSSAFLIFLVQPMVGKRILPWFGGVPAVWTLCLAFYQTTLFLGYAYAHGLIRFVPPKLQLAVHAGAVAAAIASLPVLPAEPPESLDAEPTAAVLRLLAANVALPFLVLASTGPLVQAWFARAHPTLSPYALYAVSNVGSFLALFVFPFVLEPRVSLTEAGSLWSSGFLVTGLAVLACGVAQARATARPALGASDASSDEPEPEVGHGQAVLWLGLSGTAVVLLTAITNKLCLDVASIPFLWILPLALYLVTFIAAFSSERAYRRAWFVPLAFAAFAVSRMVTATNLIVWQVAAYGVLLFSICMCLHGELYRSRPSARSLTRFYLFVSAGGAIGGLLVGIVAPLVFDDYYEFPLGLVLALLMLLLVCALDPTSALSFAKQRARWRVVAPVVALGVAAFSWHELRVDPQVIHKERSFFGVLTVHELPDAQGGRRTLTNGTTLHGLQFQGETGRRMPTAYFGRATGLGLMLTSRPREEGGSRVGVIGLGVGTLAAYGRPGDSFRFYEIDPVVIRLSGPGGYFHFVEDSRAEVEFVLGDARRSIEDEQRRGEPQNFDVLVLDAFSSDAIPVHLMTKEAFEGYFRALAPHGIMAVHVSNRHFQLMSLVSRMAAEFGAESLQIKTRPAPQLQSGLTDWVIITRTAQDVARLRIRIEQRHRALDLAPDSMLLRRGSEANLDAFPLWTDDYSDLLSVVRWN